MGSNAELVSQPMLAIIGDIHGNLEALEAVLADIARRPVSAIYCLGDIVGYGRKNAITFGVSTDGKPL